MSNFERLISSFSVSAITNDFGGDINGWYTTDKENDRITYYLTAKTYDKVMLICYESFTDDKRGTFSIYKIEPSKFNDYTYDQLTMKEPYLFNLNCTIDEACNFISNYLVGLI